MNQDILTGFMHDYENANNKRDISRLRTMIREDANYWFSDGSYEGIEAIIAAIKKTFEAIQDEIYRIDDLHWVSVGSTIAVCRYRFSWRGIVKGRPASGTGRGTNVLALESTPTGDAWKILHEHLSR